MWLCCTFSFFLVYVIALLPILTMLSLKICISVFGGDVNKHYSTQIGNQQQQHKSNNATNKSNLMKQWVHCGYLQEHKQDSLSLIAYLNMGNDLWKLESYSLLNNLQAVKGFFTSAVLAVYIILGREGLCVPSKLQELPETCELIPSSVIMYFPLELLSLNSFPLELPKSWGASWRDWFNLDEIAT